MTESASPFQLPQAYQDQWTRLTRALSVCNRVAIAYSGGVDSTFLVWFAKTVTRKDTLAVLVISPLVSARERDGARQTARDLGFMLKEVEPDVMAAPAVTANTQSRCYHCKQIMLAEVVALARSLGYATLMDGTNADDGQEYRPGTQALRECGAISPLALAGLSKNAIRELSRLADLPTWNKPAQACLATRIPYGVAITCELLTRIERAEDYLMDLGCRQVRVRVHERLARIELPPDDIPLLVEPGRRMRVVEYFCQLGFQHVSLDLAGYRSGNLDARLDHSINRKGANHAK
jgi:pyridinium-3,5-biscarboxylic acid mononucleotide sulfurtransferase